MYVPKQFEIESLGDQHKVIESNAFAVLIGLGDDGLIATHIPLLLKADEGRYGTLYGHLAKANPHAKLMGRSALAVFSGPHAYISPSWYSNRATNVPTWNYVSVHCTGTPRFCEGDPLQHLGEMVQRFEGARPRGWSLDELDKKIRETLPRGIVCFRMEIERIEGKAKLSQNKPREEQLRLIDGLKEDGEPVLAALMERV